MKVVVCGSRSWDDGDAIVEQLDRLPRDTTIIHGGARGADRVAAFLADELGFKDIVEVLPNWKLYGNRAGIVRNLEMLDMNPDRVYAFWDGRSNGTRHTITTARERGILTVVIE